MNTSQARVRMSEVMGVEGSVVAIRSNVIRFNPAGVPCIDAAGARGTAAPLSLPANAVTYECPLCGLKGLLAAALLAHVCPAVTDVGTAGVRGGPLPRHVIQAMLDGDVAGIQEHAMPKAEQVPGSAFPVPSLGSVGSVRSDSTGNQEPGTLNLIRP